MSDESRKALDELGEIDRELFGTTDIVKHLRLNAEDFRTDCDPSCAYTAHGALMLSAADEIDRLNRSIAGFQKIIAEGGEQLAEAEALLRDASPHTSLLKITGEWDAWLDRRDAWLARK